MDNDKIDQHSDEIEVESEEKERGKESEKCSDGDRLEQNLRDPLEENLRHFFASLPRQTRSKRRHICR